MNSQHNIRNQSSNVNNYFSFNNFHSGKPTQVKSTKNLNSSLGPYDSVNRFNPNLVENKNKVDKMQKEFQYQNVKYHQTQHEVNFDNDVRRKFATIATENSRLKEENEFLRKQLQKIKNHSQIKRQLSSIEKNRSAVLSRSHSRDYPSGDLRGTIKKQVSQHEVGDVKEMRVKLEILSKQCKMYEEIIDKMENTIRRLTDENKMLNGKQKFEYKPNQKQDNKSDLQQLKDRVNLVMRQYSELESKMHSNQLEWVIWKEQWITEKNIYLNKIKQLQTKLKDKQSLDKKY